MHHAVANGAGFEVIRIMCEECPESKVSLDRRRRTP